MSKYNLGNLANDFSVGAGSESAKLLDVSSNQGYKQNQHSDLQATTLAQLGVARKTRTRHPPTTVRNDLVFTEALVWLLVWLVPFRVHIVIGSVYDCAWITWPHCDDVLSALGYYCPCEASV